MRKRDKNTGFSLTEVLLAIGILGIGLLLVAGVFPVAVHFTNVATERTMAAVIADEAFAHIEEDVGCTWETGDTVVQGYLDPSVQYASSDYYWSALRRNLSGSLKQVTVFVCKKANKRFEYWGWDVNNNKFETPKHPQLVSIEFIHDENESAYLIAIQDRDPQNDPNERNFINDGYTIVDDSTGGIYRVLERLPQQPAVLRLDRPWRGPLAGNIWVIPPPVGGGTNPCIGIYQRLMRF